MSTQLAVPRVRRPLPQELEEFIQLATICNISKEPVLPINHSSFGIFHIAVPGPTERYALTPIDWAPMYMDKGDSVFNLLTGPKHQGAPIQDNRIRMVQGARQIADDLCQQMNTSDGPAGDSENSPFWGKFVCEGPEGPSEKELVANEKKLKTYFYRVVEVGDIVWGQAGRIDLIDSRCKVAAAYLGITDRPWQRAYTAQVKCPACMEDIKAGAKLCRFCGTELDSDFFAKGETTGKRKRARRGSVKPINLDDLPTIG